MVKAYNEVTQRYTTAASGAIDDDLAEAAGFLAYHAFESAGGALTTHLGDNYSKSHKGKLNQFTQHAMRLGAGIAVAQLAIQLASTRNKFLYPEQRPDGRVVRPSDVITNTQATKLQKRVRGIVEWVRAAT